MKRALLVLAVAALYVLHQDFWFWRTARLTIPFLGIDAIPFGIIPVGLFYHACFSVAASLLMWLLVRHAWPHHLEREVEGPDAEGGDES
ncbi:MAG TPA: hypothetical protein VF570_18735 [Pyrinomonadaceae bacterium]|jgi:hypothetical protein